MKIAVVICVVVNLAAAYKDTYRAAVVHRTQTSDLNGDIPAVYEAGRANVDILVLPSSDSLSSEYNYDETVKNLAKAARQAGVYVVAHLHENMRCHNKNERIRSNLVFNREGTIVSVYRKPVNPVANCTIVQDSVTFTTDFGVTFGNLMEEDLALHNPALVANINNFVVSGPQATDIPFLSASQFASPWSFVTGANVLSYSGVYPNVGVTHGERLIVADLKKEGRGGVSKPPVIDPSELLGFPGEDLSQYIIRPLDVVASRTGYKETVCHKKFCCEFYIKSSFKGCSADINYGLAAFDGVRHYDKNRYVGTQSCAVFACAGLYKKSCDVGAPNSTDVIFDKITISGNFTKHNSMQFPMIISTDSIKPSQYSMDTKTFRSRQVTIKIQDSSIFSLGIFGRDFSKDRETVVDERNASIDSDFYGLLYTENVQEFIDYLWIRLRILIFVVSIYILEMM